MAGRRRLCLFWLLVARLAISETRPITRNFDSAPVGPGICFHLKCLTTTCFSVYVSQLFRFSPSLCHVSGEWTGRAHCGLAPGAVQLSTQPVKDNAH